MWADEEANQYHAILNYFSNTPKQYEVSFFKTMNHYTIFNTGITTLILE